MPSPIYNVPSIIQLLLLLCLSSFAHSLHASLTQNMDVIAIQSVMGLRGVIFSAFCLPAFSLSMIKHFTLCHAPTICSFSSFSRNLALICTCRKFLHEKVSSCNDLNCCSYACEGFMFLPGMGKVVVGCLNDDLSLKESKLARFLFELKLTKASSMISPLGTFSSLICNETVWRF